MLITLKEIASFNNVWFADVITVKKKQSYESKTRQDCLQRSPNEFENNFLNPVSIKYSQVKDKKSLNVTNLLVKIQTSVFYCEKRSITAFNMYSVSNICPYSTVSNIHVM